MADQKKKKNIFQRIAQLFKEVRQELRKVVWPSKDKLKATSAVVLVIIVFFAVYLTVISSGGRWILEKIGFYEQVDPTETTITAVTGESAETTPAADAEG